MRDRTDDPAAEFRAGSIGLAFIGFDFWFQAEPCRSKDKVEFHRTDSEGTIGFVTLAIEQLALVTDDGFHEISFG